MLLNIYLLSYLLISPNSVASAAQCAEVAEDVVAKKFVFAVSSPDEFLGFKPLSTLSFISAFLWLRHLQHFSNNHSSLAYGGPEVTFLQFTPREVSRV